MHCQKLLSTVIEAKILLRQVQNLSSMPLTGVPNKILFFFYCLSSRKFHNCLLSVRSGLSVSCRDNHLHVVGIYFQLMFCGRQSMLSGSFPHSIALCHPGAGGGLAVKFVFSVNSPNWSLYEVFCVARGRTPGCLSADMSELSGRHIN